MAKDEFVIELKRRENVFVQKDSKGERNILETKRNIGTKPFGEYAISYEVYVHIT